MREPKFRGFSKETNSWHYGHGWFEIDYTDEYLLEKGIEKQAMLYTAGYPVECELKSMGNYTGLKDKNGNEIFEEDIIYWEIDNGVGIESYTAIVKWTENLVEEGWSQTYKWLVGYTGNYYRGSYDELSTPAAYNDELQVIGNIYENPELLEETA